MSTSFPPPGIRTAQGFTLIEVLVSLIILSVGLLGLGLLQAQSLKASYGSNHRTIATNLAYQLLDEMRANRLTAYKYAAIAPGDFAGINASTCNPAPSTGAGNLEIDDIAGWECQVVQDLPGNPTPTVAVNMPATPPTGGAALAGDVTIVITWTDLRFQSAADQNNTFTLSTEL